MASALEVASLFATLDLRDNLTGALRGAHSQLNNFSGSLDSVGQSLQRVGVFTGIAGAAILAGLGGAARQATTFEHSMTNVQAVLSATDDDMVGLSRQVLELGRLSQYGPQAMAEAFYDIVGGVADASKHMEVLQAANLTATAGQADLGATTGALISIMNSYAASGLSAADASDVLTRTVGVGVGTMDEFAAAFPTVAGLASSLDISFQDLGAAMAFLTTKGFSASESATQLRAMMVALLNPNERMIKALQELGVTSGEAALQQFGLVGAFTQLQNNSTTFRNEMAGTLGSVQALNGVIALTGEGAADALGSFNDGLEGATELAAEIQFDSVATRIDRLKSQFSALAIEIGNALIPAINSIINRIYTFLTPVAEWIRNNQELIPTIVGAAAALAGFLVAIGPIGTAIRAVGTAIGLLTSPITGVIAVIAGLTAAYLTNFGGFRDFVDGQVRPVLDELFRIISEAWERVRPGLEDLAHWFLDTALPDIVNFVQTTVFPAIEDIFNFIADVWNFVRPGLESVFNWFVNEGLPRIVEFVNGVVVPAIEGLINLWSGIWDAVRSGVEAFANGIQNALGWVDQNVLQPIRNGIYEIQRLIAQLTGQPMPLPPSQAPSPAPSPVVPPPGTYNSGNINTGGGFGTPKGGTTINVYANDRAGGTAAGNAFERSFNNTYNRGR